MSQNAYSNRSRWWYESIADLMIANPDMRQNDIAAALKRHPCTISLIVNTDMFKEILAQRRKQFRERSDLNLSQKMGKVAELGLDIILETMTTKRDGIPLGRVAEITESVLDRLGYAPAQAPTVQINAPVDNSQKVIVAVGSHELAEAREALRRAEEARRLPSPPLQIDHNEEEQDALNIAAE